jgi:hypothetical protein
MPIWLRSSLTSIVAGAEKAGPEAGKVYKAAVGNPLKMAKHRVNDTPPVAQSRTKGVIPPTVLHSCPRTSQNFVRRICP